MYWSIYCLYASILLNVIILILSIVALIAFAPAWVSLTYIGVVILMLIFLFFGTNKISML